MQHEPLEDLIDFAWPVQLVLEDQLAGSHACGAGPTSWLSNLCGRPRHDGWPATRGCHGCECDRSTDYSALLACSHR